MTIGTEIYNADNPPVIARGTAYSDEELNWELEHSIPSILWDDEGTSELESMLAGISDTKFSSDKLQQILKNQPINENWRVGESLAEAFLVEHRGCEFPWSSLRDLKNPAASPAGADLVGFQETASPTNPHRFAFGEIKTSQQKAWPPGVVNSSDGLKKQLKDLRDSTNVKDNLFRYLAHRAQNSDWFALFKSAATRYFRSKGVDVSLFGVLIRDVDPKSEDLSKLSENLAADCPLPTSIELRAIYLPQNAIGSLAERVRKVREDSHDVD